MLAASGSSMPKAFLKLMIVSTSFPLSSSPPGGRTEDTNLNQVKITKILTRIKIRSKCKLFNELEKTHSTPIPAYWQYKSQSSALNLLPHTIPAEFNIHKEISKTSKSKLNTLATQVPKHQMG